MKDGKMLWRFHRLAALVAAILTAGASPAEEQVLYWMVDGSAKVDKQDGSSPVSVLDYFADPEVQASGSDFAARIRVTGGDIPEGEDRFLDIYIPGYGIYEGGGAYGVSFSDSSGYWGAGVPTGNQSPSDTYFVETPEYSFIVELGNLDSSDNWTTVARSAAAVYSQLVDSYIHRTFDMNPSPLAVWTPAAFTAVPEPSGGLLVLVGGALLALRRRNGGA